MRKLTVLLLIVLLLPMTFVVQGQVTDQVATLPLVKQCFVPHTEQEESSSFSGTMVLTSLGRLHAFRAEWDTPRISAFFQAVDTALSPDHRWFAFVEGGSNTDGMVTVFSTSRLRVVNTLDGNEYALPWENRYASIHRIYGHQLYWLDNERLLYSIGDQDEHWFEIDPFQGEIQSWHARFTPSYFAFELAPNGEYGLSADWPEPFWSIHTPMTDITMQTALKYSPIAWHPSELYFAGVVFPQASEAEAVVTVTLDGAVDEVLYRDDSPETRINQLQWSPDGRYLAFSTEYLYIADIERQIIIDTCLTSSPRGYFSMAWAPTSTQLALLNPYDPNREIRVIDLESFTEAVVGYHSGEVIGWRADEAVDIR